ncbi:MAG: serine hydrolase [Bacteroidetes bacterium]|nr:serine hydrolase [Bacteroidota bacterium]
MKKFLKRTLIILGGILILFFGYVIISGDTYVFFLLRHTVLKGRLGPSVLEYKIYENREVNIGQPRPWIKSKEYNSSELHKDELKYHEKYGSLSFLVIRNDSLLFEQYWDEGGADVPTNSWSMAKSIVSHLIGCALKDNLIQSVEDKVSDYIPEYNTGEVKIRDLLTMSSGINFDEDYLNPFAYPARSLYGDDIRKTHLKYKPEKKAGEQFDYQSANTELLAFIVMKVTGKTLSDYASEKLWKPIGAENPAFWSTDHKDGVEKAFCCFNSNARDFAKFGKLYLHQGVSSYDTLINNDYFRQATVPARYLKDGEFNNNRYGYQWWTMENESDTFFYARGIQGQYIFILPQENLVIVRLGKSRPDIRINGHPEDVYKYVEQGKRIAGN